MTRHAHDSRAGYPLGDLLLCGELALAAAEARRPGRGERLGLGELHSAAHPFARVL